MAWLEMVDAAAQARVGYHVMHGWALKGWVVAERRQGHWFVDPTSLDAFLQVRTATGATAGRAS